MNSHKAKELKQKYKQYCIKCNQPETKASWRRFKKLYTLTKSNFLK